MISSYKWRHRFRKHVSRWTLPREAILDLLSRTSKHMSAKEIYTYLIRDFPGIGLSTVYRTLDILSQMGLVNKLDIGDNKSFYEFRSEKRKDHHHHIICTICGKIIDYSDFIDEEQELVRKTEKRLAQKYNFMVKEHNIEFYGICKDCQ